jgi:hypothetical protein
MICRRALFEPAEGTSCASPRLQMAGVSLFLRVEYVLNGRSTLPGVQVSAQSRARALAPEEKPIAQIEPKMHLDPVLHLNVSLPKSKRQR